jgi:hypothetical protein
VEEIRPGVRIGRLHGPEKDSPAPLVPTITSACNC